MAKKTLTLKFPPGAPKGAADDIHLALKIGSKSNPVRDQLDAQNIVYDDVFVGELQLDVNAHARLQDSGLLDQPTSEHIGIAIYHKLAQHIAERN